jgi:ribonuclease-3
VTRKVLDPDEAARAVDLASAALGVEFGDADLVRTALSVPDWAASRGLDNYQRLELLGDAVVGLIAVDHVYREHPELHEGGISRAKSEVVSGPSLAAAAERMGLADAVLTDQEIGPEGSRRRQSVLSDIFEALIGALYLDQGLESARAVVARVLLAEAVPLALSGATRDPKGMLQEARAEAGLTPPEYRLASSEGPDHDPVFHVEVLLDDRVAGAGSGRSKKAAEQAAAAQAIAAAPKAPKA